MISWGLVASVMGLIQSSRQFYGLRFLLGLAEASEASYSYFPAQNSEGKSLGFSSGTARFLHERTKTYSHRNVCFLLTRQRLCCILTLSHA
jgi:hypothetical protein